MVPLVTAELMVTCTARAAFSAASDAATTAAADPADGAVAAEEGIAEDVAAGDVAAGDVAAGDVAAGALAGAFGPGTALVQPASSADNASSASPARLADVRALRNRFTFLC